MVLEGATSADSVFPDDNPSSDIDPYAAQSKSADPALLAVTAGPNPVYVNLETLPKRWSLLVSKPHPPKIRENIIDQCNFAGQILGRPVNQQEADALTYHFTKSLRIGSYGSPIGAVLGTVFAVRGQATYRFPLWSPMKEGGRFSPEVFGPLKGSAAKAAWNMTRLSAYWIVGSFVCNIFFGSYALSTAMAGRAMDPRLKEFTEALKDKAKQRGTGRPVDTTPARRESETFEMARQRRVAQEAGRTGGHEAHGNSDDASPTGGMFANDYKFASDEPAMQTDEQVRQQENRDRTTQQQAYATANRARQETPANQASPAPGNARQSSWDRLRQGAMSGQSSQSSRPTQSSQTSNDDPFGLSPGDREIADARSEAQRQFDQSIERERSGQDFEGSKSGGWRR